jgi:hypothetical protein
MFLFFKYAIIGLFIVFNCNGQSYFNSLHYEPFALTVLPLKNGNILMGGGGWNPINLQIHITLFDYKGDTIMHKGYFDEPYVTNLRKLIKLNEFYYYGLCTIKDTIGVQSDVMIIKFNHMLDTLWTKRYRYSNYEFVNDAIVLLNGNVIMVGNSNSFGNNTQGFLMCVDSTGNTLWKKTYGGTADETFYSIDIDNQGDIIIGGGYSQTNDDNAGYIVKTDINGNLIWEKYYGKNNNKQDNISFVSVLPDNNLLMAHSEGYNLSSYELKGTV